MKKHSVEGKLLNGIEFSAFNPSLANVPIFYNLWKQQKTLGFLVFPGV